jgi:hypothetical protein
MLLMMVSCQDDTVEGEERQPGRMSHAVDTGQIEHILCTLHALGWRCSRRRPGGDAHYVRAWRLAVPFALCLQ